MTKCCIDECTLNEKRDQPENSTSWEAHWRKRNYWTERFNVDLNIAQYVWMYGIKYLSSDREYVDVKW